LELEELFNYHELSIENYKVELKETAKSPFWESTYLFSPAFSNKFPEDSSKANHEEFLELRRDKTETVDAINDNKATLEAIKSARTLDGRLPEAAREKNGFLLDLKEEYPAFFDEESGNSSINEGLNDLEKYIQGENKSLGVQLSEINSNIENLQSNKNETEAEKVSKRNLDELDADNQPASKKISHSNDKDKDSSGPSQSDPGPSQSNDAPSQSNDAPSQSNDAPSQSNDAPSQSDDGSGFGGGFGGGFGDFF
jgi:hypothetical protein